MPEFTEPIGPADQPWAVWLTASDQVLERPTRDAALATAAARNNAFAQQAPPPAGPTPYAVVLHHGVAWRGEEAGPGARVSPDTRKVHVQFADLLREQIGAGLLAPGAILPAQRDLAATYRVGLKTVQRGQELLQAEGLLARSGRRVLVTSPPTAAAVPAQSLPGLDLVPIQPAAETDTSAGSHFGTAAYRRLAQRLAQLIDAGAYPAGAEFPTAGSLAQQHGYTVTSARQAVRSLKDLGVLADGPGGVTVVAHSAGAGLPPANQNSAGDTTAVISAPTPT
ncbi:GntR family transcriptional regulator [Streptomyces griseus]|uniref:GntR family transcriptional regulator n=1 Tax=Streptomyces griseus TaxID=1911 RepID=UPI0037BCEFAC